MNDPQRGISPDRKALYYCGIAVTVIGVCLFLSVFVSGAMNFGNFDNFEARGRSEAMRAIVGMILFGGGQVMMVVGARGMAGSGLLLEPDKAREDLKPWNKMAGGMLDDTLSEVGLVKKLEDRLEPAPPQVKVRCRKCNSLNDETAKFCNQCGAEL